MPEKTRARLILPTYGIGRRLDDLGDERARRVARQVVDGLAGGRVDVGEDVLGGRGERRGDDLEQLVEAESGQGADGDDGEEGTARDGGLEVVDEQVDVDVLATHVAVHQALVLGLLDHSLDQRAAVLLDEQLLVLAGLAHHPALGRELGVVGHGLRQQRDEVVDLGTGVSHGHVERDDLVTEGVLCGLEHRGVVGALVVELADHDAARHADGLALLPQRLGRAVDALTGGDDEQRAVGGAETRAQVAHEVGVPGGVEEVDLDGGVAASGDQRDQGQPDRPLLADLGLVVVGGAGAVLDAAEPVDRSGRVQQGLDEGGLAGAGRPHQDDVTNRIGGGGLVRRRLGSTCPRWFA